MPSDGIRSPLISRLIVQWSTPDWSANWRWLIFFSFSCARSHELKERGVCSVIPDLCDLHAPTLGRTGGARRQPQHRPAAGLSQ